MKKIVNRIFSVVLAVTMLVGTLPNMNYGVLAEVSTSGGSNDFPIVSSSKTATIWVDANEEVPVKRVVNDFKEDVNRVTGKTPTISNSSILPSGPVVIIGTIGKSAQIKNLINNGKITTSEVNAVKDKWEAYLIKVVDKNTMVIMGSDNRGAIFGTYEVSEQMGVSPWYFFADVPIQKKSTVFMPASTSITDKPDVKYRGIFINDEEKLNSWVVNKFNPEYGGSGKMGAAIYAKIFELILRLKGNYLWPAMHVNAFDNIPENITTIDEYGVVMRKTISAGDEWGTFKKKYASQKGIDASTLSYDYTVNPEAVQAFWIDSISKHKNSEVQWLLGMRGEGDEPFNTANLSDSKYDKYGSDTESRKAGLLSQIIADQITILRQELGTEKANSMCKGILPYKEVLQLYNNSQFQMPDDMTVIWCDDNHGMVRKTPTEEDRAKAAGGIYMHASYWAPANQSYMWMSSIPLSIIGEELNKCWQTGIQNIWVLNVGDIKPMEGEMDYFIRCGWDVEKYTKDSEAFSKEWMKRNFGDTMSEATQSEVADILDTFYHNSNIRKTEHMAVGVFEQTQFNEWDKRMDIIQNIYDRARKVAAGLTSAQQDAFYELVQCKINWFFYTNKMYYYADKSNLAYDQGRYASAQNFSDLSVKVETQRKTEIAKYGKISSGKWVGLIDPEKYSPPVTTQFPETNPTLVLGKPKMGVIVQGEERAKNKASALTFSRYSTDGKFIDVFNKGAGSVSFTATVDKEWLSLSATTGTFNDEQRVWVNINDFDAAAGKTATITFTSNDVVKKVKVVVEDVQSGITNTYVEADGYVSMKAEHISNISSAGTKSWKVIKNAGRVDGDMMQAFDSNLGMVDSNNINTSTSPCLSYNFYLTSEGEFPLEVYRLPTMNAVNGGQLRFAVSIDGGNPIIVSSTATDEGTTSNQNKQWVKNIFGMIEKHIVNLPYMTSGNHTLKLWMVDNYITIDKMVIYTSGTVVKSSTGPEESYHSVFNNTVRKNVPQISRTSVQLEEKNIIDGWGSGLFLENNGKVGIEAEYAMENVLDSVSQVTADMNAYTVSKKAKAIESGKVANEWRLTQSDTGLAMRTPDYGSGWSDSTFVNYAPELSYRIKYSTAGTYNVWLRWRYIDNASDSIRGGVDNVFTNKEFTTGGGFHKDSNDEKWYWQKVGAVSIASAGSHVFSLWEREDGLIIDKIYLTTGTETPTESSFTVSARSDSSVKSTFIEEVKAKRAEADSMSYPLGENFGNYSVVAYNKYIETIEAAEKQTLTGNITATNSQTLLNNIENAKQALMESQILTENYINYNAFRDFEDDKVGAYPFGFEKQALTNGGAAIVCEENGNKYLSITTGSTSGKANIVLPYSGTVAPVSGEKVVIEFSARFTGTFNYANAAMIKNDVDKFAMVAAFENANQVREIRIQNAGTKTKVMNFESGEWYDFRLVGDFAAGKYTAYINGAEVAKDFTFRDATGTKLTGHLFGIDGFANGRVDYDNFKVRVLSSSYINDSSSLISTIVAARRADINKYSYPLGDSVGCYSKTKHDAYIAAIDNADEASKSQITYEQSVRILEEIANAEREFKNSLNLPVTEGKAYVAYRDFENDTLGSYIPYGIIATNIDNGGATTILREDGNKFLRLSTGAEAGHVNMILPYLAKNDDSGDYVKGITTDVDELIVIEFEGRYNTDFRYANACIVKNQVDNAATTMAFDNSGSSRRVVLKKSASNTSTIANFEFGKWHKYKTVIDLEEQTYDVYMDGILVAQAYPFRTEGSNLLISHGFGIDGFANGQLDIDNIKVVVEGESTIPVSEGIEINGYQVSATSQGMRTVYSVDSKIDGQNVIGSGIVYSLSSKSDSSELYVGSDNAYVLDYASTEKGLIDSSNRFSSKDSTYAMTMLFMEKNANEYNLGWRIRAYAQLEDGSYVYSQDYEYTIYKVAHLLYINNLMSSQSKHEYLYQNILKVVDANYSEIPFKWSGSLAK